MRFAGGPNMSDLPNERDADSAHGDELRRLAARYCEGDLGDDEFRKLEGLLRDDPEARSVFLDYREIHASLSINALARNQAGTDSSRRER